MINYEAEYYKMKVANVGHLKGIKRLKEQVARVRYESCAARELAVTLQARVTYLSNYVHPTVKVEADRAASAAAVQFYNEERK